MVTQKALKTKERILVAATQCFFKYGYHATGLEQIIKTAEVTKGNFYYYFKSKEILALETLDWQFEKITNDIKEQVLNKKTKPLATLFALFDLMTNRQKQQHKEGQICGCYFGNFALELSPKSSQVSAKIKQIFSQYAQLISDLIQQAIDAKEISNKINADKMGSIILGQLEGAILLDKTNQQPSQVDHSIDFIKQYLQQ